MGCAAAAAQPIAIKILDCSFHLLPIQPALFVSYPIVLYPVYPYTGMQ